MKVYFDSAASSQLHPEVLKAMLPFYTEVFGNPSSTHSFGRKARAGIERARKTIAKALNVSPLEIVFTSGGTEANNMALKCAANQFEVKHIITTNFEHKCVKNTCEDLVDKNSINLHLLDVCQKGKVDLEQLNRLLKNLEGKKLVTIMHANNEIGTIADIKKIGELCSEYDALFHSDTVQTVGHYNLDISAINVHYVSGSAHKFHGPTGVGFLYMRKDVKLCPLIHGGGQERSFRSGTENVAGIIGMERALEIAMENLENDKAHVTDLKVYLREKLVQNIQDISFNGDVDNGLYSVLNVSFPASFNSEMLLFKLDIAGIAVSGGSACSSGANVGSHVMQAIGHKIDRKAIRFSFSHFNTKEEIDYCIEELVKLEQKVVA